MAKLRCLLLSGVLLLLLHSPAAAQNEAHKSVLIEEVPHVRQKPDFCGEACAEMYLAKLGSKIDQDDVFDLSGLDPLEGRGCWTRELATALSRIGFRAGSVWYQVAVRDADRQMALHFAAMHADLVAGVPSILCMHYDDSPNAAEHFRLIVGYDEEKDEVIYHEPASLLGAHRRMKREMLLKLWPLKYAPHEWTIIRFRLDPAQIVNKPGATGLSNADYAQSIMRLKEKLAGLKEQQISLKELCDAEIEREAEKARIAREKCEEYEVRNIRPRFVSEFNFVLQEPFVVVGDDTPAGVRSHAQGTIRWAVDRLKRSFFSRDPDSVITIWLFKDKPSYEQNVVDIFRRSPHTPYGYHSPGQKAIVMNIDTGGGTLVHEIVHPFVAANFPECPAWLNEGLGSLYEQCEDRNGRIWGLTNWRLRGLQKAIERAAEDEENEGEDYKLPTFEELCSTTTRQFYDRDPGTNYAQARYLLYFLQHRGVLREFYHRFHRSVKDDPTGYKTLQRVLGEEDMEKFQEKWTEFVMDLQF